MDQVVIRPATDVDHPRIVDLLSRSWGSTTVVAHGVKYDASTLPALLAVRRGRLAGLLTYTIGGDAFEVVSIDAVVERAGVGTALLEAAVERAEAAGLARLWLVTTNDNLDALRFYQRRGMRLVQINRGAVDESRKLKPRIPLTGEFGIEIHDEIMLEMRLPRRESHH
ncbi:GNAT family N-acetyltransferase [Paractinoplanes globisporus]|uniref:GNAT family N-acetyltransferase n=1 Tax=Paractinoplanes globisporus TaxID=113565 RepID=A0ABW6WAR6_9ACTN|nr:GNAT family N-acetyltransferase [Actinoplanes globisporus]